MPARKPDDKGKPVERQGRKALGLTPVLRVRPPGYRKRFFLTGNGEIQQISEQNDKGESKKSHYILKLFAMNDHGEVLNYANTEQ